MSPRVANAIIAFSIIGLVVVSVRDRFFSEKAVGENRILPTATPTLHVAAKRDKDPQVPCQHTFFNFTEGTAWNYRLTSELTLQDKTTRETENFTNTVVATDSSSLTIETRFTDGETSEKKLTCRTSGLRGFPYPLLPRELVNVASSQAQFLSFLKIDPQEILSGGDYLFLPPSTNFKKGTKWKTESLMTVRHIVASESNRTVPGAGYKKVLNVSSEIETEDSLLGLLALGSQESKDSNVFEYSVAEDVGITSLKIDWTVPQVGRVRTTLILMPSPPSSSQ